tara:strand:+ start:2245 stop:3084 length:840 start_codon:yes stop_codon:yes gene_type:complete
MKLNNRDENLIDDFGNEWKKFNQHDISEVRNKELFDKYFSIFPWNRINKTSVGIDVGSGSGRWSYFLANKVKKLYLVEPSVKAINVSKYNLSKFKNIEFLNNDANNIPLKNETIDFAICLGVLHHIPNIEIALKSINSKLKKNAPFLLYIYYSFENKPMWFKLIWKVSDLLRKFISRLPFFMKSFICDLIAILIYFPLSRFSKLIRYFNFDVRNIPLSFYSDKSIYILRNDSLDRFGTKIEQRLSMKEIQDLLLKTGFNNISFSKKEPYWCAICYKSNK